METKSCEKCKTAPALEGLPFCVPCGRAEQFNSRIPPQYRSASFDDVDAESRNIASRFAANPEGCLFICGPAGTGKTRLLYAIAREMHVHNSKKPDFMPGTLATDGIIPAIELCKQMAGVMAAYGADEELKAIKNLINKPTLLIDDLGTEKTTDYIKQNLQYVISEREAWGRATAITSNLKLRELADKFDDRIASRLAGGQVIQLVGADYRLKNRR